MQHPSQILIPEYRALLPTMKILPARQAEVDAVAKKLLRHLDAGDYGNVSQITGVPFLFVGPSFEREASSDFRLSPAQGDPWNRKSVNVPKNRGPFPSWEAAAEDAYALDGLDQVGAGNWTYELICYYGELFNGFGYRDFHHMRTPYLCGASNLQQPGKYVSDGKFKSVDASGAPLYDQQIGVMPMVMRLGELRPQIRLSAPWPFVDPSVVPAVPPIAPPATTGLIDAFDLQKDLNALGYGPLLVDGNYGNKTKLAVRAFQADHPPLDVDGMAGPATDRAIAAALSAKVKGL